MRAAKTFSQLKEERGLACKQDNRESASMRGYDRKWRNARRGYLARNPLCVECKKKGVVKMAVIVDHIIPHKGNRKLFADRNNWQSLCKRCHDSKTAKQSGGIGGGYKIPTV